MPIKQLNLHGIPLELIRHESPRWSEPSAVNELSRAECLFAQLKHKMCSSSLDRAHLKLHNFEIKLGSVVFNQTSSQGSWSAHIRPKLIQSHLVTRSKTLAQTKPIYNINTLCQICQNRVDLQGIFMCIKYLRIECIGIYVPSAYK